MTVVAEGRCALMATYQIFQFVVGYAMCQAFAVNLMYTYALQMGNYMFLIQVRLRCAPCSLLLLLLPVVAVVGCCCAHTCCLNQSCAKRY